MKFVLLLALLSVALAQDVSPPEEVVQPRQITVDAPRETFRETTRDRVRSPEGDIQVVNEVREGPVNGAYRFLYELENGVVVEESATVGDAGQPIVQGRYSFITPEGITVDMTYTAGEGGFQPQSDALPVDHPLPEHVQELLRIADQQRAEGVQFNDQGVRI